MQKRGFFLLLGLLLGIAAIVVMSILFKAGSTLGVILLDKQAQGGSLPYPFTFQNLMFLVFFVSLAEIGYRRQRWVQERSLQSFHILPEDDRTILIDQDLANLRKKLEQHHHHRRDIHLIRLIDQCILHFQANRSVESTHQLLNSLTELELHRVDLRYSLLRYFAWILPTLGFIGTVVGIGQGLTQFAELVKEGKKIAEILPSVTANLGMAFNTTIVALVMSVVVVWAMQSVQQKEEETINHSSNYCLENLINRLYIPKPKE